ncbi:MULTISPECIES: PTS sugar transporter subunit IIA [Bacillus]|uniref:PTS system glucose-specific EIIA component n=1 Tax=Bacillus rhizoplanae TaxID=2880966 RepID=A0ABM8Y8T7_9BACI|nr:PTS glucose transporter subunit IIA [Bacillus rhizoplanae]CAG9612071.1 PTS system glucose-specific EIIA component [Bacillus rhizoplanae]
MFKKLFGLGSKTNAETIVAPLTGEVKNIEEVPDPVFAGRMMGNGVAIDPTEGVVVSPVDGEIVQLFHTKHAVGIKSKNGAEILIHVGLETVTMAGEGFEAHVAEGQTVKVGDKLISFDLELIREKAKSTITPIVITNTDATASIETTIGVTATKGSTEVMKVTMK